MESDKDIADIKMKMMMGIKVPMRDGIELTTDIYLPEDKLPCPIILQRSPYNSNVEASVKEAVYLVKDEPSSKTSSTGHGLGLRWQKSRKSNAAFLGRITTLAWT